MSVTGPNTGFKIVNADGGPYTQDLGQRYVSKDYLLDVYPNLVPGRTTPGLWAWGLNDVGQLGNGTIVSKSSPVQVGSLTNWKQVAAGEASFAITTDGKLYAWGRNNAGQLGDGTIIHRSSPIQIGSLTNWKQVATGLDTFSPGQMHVLAIKTDGTLWAWGLNNSGQLGDGTIVSKSSPVQIGSLTNWKQVAVADRFSGAVKTDGTLWTWGKNTSGELGQGNITSRSSPVQVGTLTNWKQVAGSESTMSAITTDGKLYAWGLNDVGQLGDGTIIHRSSPVQVGSLTNWKQVSVGEVSVLAIKTDGTLWAWGGNGDGEFGDGTVIRKSSPIQVGSLTNWKQVSTQGRGDAATAAIKTDGTLWIWGRNNAGQLGDGTIVNKSSPVQIGTLTNWKQVSMGQNFSISILDGYI